MFLAFCPFITSTAFWLYRADVPRHYAAACLLLPDLTAVYARKRTRYPAALPPGGFTTCAGSPLFFIPFVLQIPVDPFYLGPRILRRWTR